MTSNAITAHDLRSDPAAESHPRAPEESTLGPGAGSLTPVPTEPPRSRRSRTRLLLFMALPVALLVGGYFYVTGGRFVWTDDAYVQAERVGVSTDVSGIVDSMLVHDNEFVRSGQVLYRLRQRPYVIALARAQAQLGLVRDALQARKADYSNMQVQIRQATIDATYYQTELRRQQTLVASHVSSAQALDAAQRAFETAQQRVLSLKDQLAGIVADLAGNPDIRIEDHPRYRNALADRDEAQRQLDHTVVTAPFDGIVTGVSSTAPGRYLAASGIAFYLVSASRLWVDANPKETQLTWVRVGQDVDVTVDTYPDLHWRGVVESISPAAAQEFALLPAENTSGNWVKVVQRIPLRVALDHIDPRLPPLRAGMSVEISIDTHHPHGWPGFLRGLFGSGRNG